MVYLSFSLTARYLPALFFTFLFSSLVFAGTGIEDQWTKVGNGTFVVTDTNTQVNAIVIVSKKEAALVGVGINREKALNIKKFFKDRGLVLKYIIVTQYHENHIKNMPLFSEFKAENITPFRVRSDKTVPLGNRTLKIFQSKRFRSDNHISVNIDGKILIAGDVIVTNRKVVAMYQRQMDLLNKLKRSGYSAIVPGYGRPIIGRRLVDEFFNRQVAELKYGIVVKNNWVEIGKDIVISSNPSERDNNMTLVVSGNEATLIDVGSGGGKSTRNVGVYRKGGDQSIRIKKYLEAHNLVLKNIIITHYHWDHAENLSMFKTDEVTLFDPVNITDFQTVTMGKKVFTLFYTEGHLPKHQHISVEIDSEILVAGDVVCDIATPDLLLAGRKQLEPYIQTLEKLKQRQYPLIIPGHGKPFINDDIITDYLRFLYKKRN